jgi:hypothetical protein
MQVRRWFDTQDPERRVVLKAGFAACASAWFTSNAAAADTRPVPLTATWELWLLVDQSVQQTNFAAQMLAAAVQNAGGAMMAGTVVESGSLSRDGDYTVTSTSTGTGLLASVWRGHLVRESRGTVINGRLATTRYAETRGDRAPLVATADRAAHSMTFEGDGAATTQSMPTDPTDLGALPWMFAGRKLPTAAFTLDYTNARKLYRATFDVAADKVDSPAGPLDAVKITSRRNAPDDPRVDIWLRRTDGVPVRVRIDLDARYGAIIEQRRSDKLASIDFGSAR